MSAKKISYQKAMEELEAIKHKIQNDEIDLDMLSKEIQRAKELIQICQAKLKSTQDELENLFSAEEK